MDDQNNTDEHIFWLKILSDHLELFAMTLVPTQIEVSERIETLKDELEACLVSFNLPEIVKAVVGVIDLKKDLLAYLINVQGEAVINLPPTFINHTLNEAEEYLRIVKSLIATGQMPDTHILDCHYLWLNDAVGHADFVASNLDPTQSRQRKALGKTKKELKALVARSSEYIGYLRTGNMTFPALESFNGEVREAMIIFYNMLRELREMRLSSEVLGTVAPMLLDHMMREECYYIDRIARKAGLETPNCSFTERWN